MDELSTILSLLRNVSSATRLIENYIVCHSTYNPGKLEEFKHALDHIEKIKKNVEEIAGLDLQLQGKI